MNDEFWDYIVNLITMTFVAFFVFFMVIHLEVLKPNETSSVELTYANYGCDEISRNYYHCRHDSSPLYWDYCNHWLEMARYKECGSAFGTKAEAYDLGLQRGCSNGCLQDYSIINNLSDNVSLDVFDNTTAENCEDWCLNYFGGR